MTQICSNRLKMQILKKRINVEKRTKSREKSTNWKNDPKMAQICSNRLQNANFEKQMGGSMKMFQSHPLFRSKFSKPPPDFLDQNFEGPPLTTKMNMLRVHTIIPTGGRKIPRGVARFFAVFVRRVA